MKIHSIWFPFQAILLCLSFLLTESVNDSKQSDVISFTEHVLKDDARPAKDLGMIRYHYDSSLGTTCSNILILGVGTDMSVSDYDKLSKKVALGTSTIVVIADHNHGNLVKTSPEKYARLVNSFYIQMTTLLPICSEEATPKILIGGHSSSGEASMKAIQLDLIQFDIAGYVGLDPYDLSEKAVDGKSFVLNHPGLYWGFTKTTCLVSVDKAAKAAYRHTNKDSRVLYAIQNNDSDCKITHCVFTDHGCGTVPFTCPTHSEFDWIFEYVAKSIHLFLDAIDKNTPSCFCEQSFELHVDQADVVLYVNDDEVPSLDAIASNDEHSLLVKN